MKPLTPLILVPVSKPMRILGVHPKAGGFLLLLGLMVATLLDDSLWGIVTTLVLYGGLLGFSQREYYFAECVIAQVTNPKGQKGSWSKHKVFHYDA